MRGCIWGLGLAVAACAGSAVNQTALDDGGMDAPDAALDSGGTLDAGARTAVSDAGRAGDGDAGPKTAAGSGGTGGTGGLVDAGTPDAAQHDDPDAAADAAVELDAAMPQAGAGGSQTGTGGAGQGGQGGTPSAGTGGVSTAGQGGTGNQAGQGASAAQAGAGGQTGNCDDGACGQVLCTLEASKTIPDPRAGALYLAAYINGGSNGSPRVLSPPLGGTDRLVVQPATSGLAVYVTSDSSDAQTLASAISNSDVEFVVLDARVDTALAGSTFGDQKLVLNPCAGAVGKPIRRFRVTGSLTYASGNYTYAAQVELSGD